jgi:MFS family permease
MSSATEDRPAAPGDRRWLILVVVAIAQLMVVLDSTIVNIALPSAQRALGFSNNDRQWVVTVYALAFGSLLLVGGRLGDMFSRKRVFITGLIGFAIASAIGGASVSFLMLVAARALQGAFGAVLAPSALGTLVSTFQEPRERGRAFGVFGSVAAGGGAVGLILGGVLTQYLSWRWCLYVNLVFAVIAVAGALAWIGSSRPDVRPRMDWPGAVLACAGLFLIVFGFSRAETAGWTAPQTIGSLAGGVVLLAGFVAAERRSSHPLLPLRVVLDRARGGSYVAVFIAGIAIFATFLFLTFYLQVVKGESPLATGLLFLPMVGCILISSNLSSIVGLARLGPRALIAAGMLLGAGGMAYLVNTMQQVGGSIGISALSTIALSATASYLIAHHTGPLAPATAATHGYTVAFTVSAALFGLGFILAIVLVPSKHLLTELRNAAATAAPAAAAPATSPAAPAPQPAFEAIPVALCSCSPVVAAVPGPAATPVH